MEKYRAGDRRVVAAHKSADEDEERSGAGAEGEDEAGSDGDFEVGSDTGSIDNDDEPEMAESPVRAAGAPPASTTAAGSAAAGGPQALNLLDIPDGEQKVIRLLPSVHSSRPPVVFFPYAAFLGEERPVPPGVQLIEHSGAKRPGCFKIASNVHEYNCVRNAFLRAGLKRTTGSAWNVIWSKHFTENEYMAMAPYQRMNHFPGSWALGRKDRLARGMARMRRTFGAEYAFSAQTYIWPADRAKLVLEMEANPKAIWILKPSASSCGRGIRLTSGATGGKLPSRTKKYLAQQYITNPYLINGRKFDLRIYVLVTSFDPLRIYLFDNGLARFATEKYTLNLKSLKNRYCHLTNYSVNKHSQKFEKNEDASNDQSGSKWSLQALLRYLKEEKRIDTKALMANIEDLIIKTILTCEAEVVSLTTRYFHQHAAMGAGCPCFELFGFDVLIDENLRPWLIEVNVSPSLSSSSPLDKKIKNTLLTDVFQLAGVTSMDPRSIEAAAEKDHAERLLGKGAPRPARRLRSARDLAQLTPADLSSDEMNIIYELEDESRRSGHFKRIFPTESTSMYDRFFSTQRASNVLLQLWLTQWRGLTARDVPRKLETTRATPSRTTSFRSTSKESAPSRVESKHAAPRTPHAMRLVQATTAARMSAEPYPVNSDPDSDRRSAESSEYGSARESASSGGSSARPASARPAAGVARISIPTHRLMVAPRVLTPNNSPRTASRAL